MKYVFIFKSSKNVGNILNRSEIAIVRLLFLVNLKTMWCKWFRSPLNGCFFLINIIIKSLNISSAGIIKIINTSSPNRKLLKFLYWYMNVI